MNFIDKIKNVKTIVEVLLIRYPELRDSDTKLMLNVWAEQHPKVIDEKYPYFAEQLRSGKISTPESIARIRRKIQEKRPELKGVKYKERNVQEKIVRNQINKN